MTLRADVELASSRTLRVAAGVTRDRIDGPRRAATLVECHGQSFRAAAEGGETCVLRSRAVASLATDADLAPGRGIGVRARVVVLLQVGRMAIGAHVVPVLLPFRPVQLVAVIDPFIRVQVEPALPS